MAPDIAQAKDLADRTLTGDRRAIARSISLVEDGDPLAGEVIRLLFPHTGRAIRVGITGPPGVGKSSLISGLIKAVRAEGRSVGVVSVDPSSPFTKGALLGDRIRLTEHFLDTGVFIRSMGSRGHLGGLAETTMEAVMVLDAAGKDVVFVETVGVGQSEIEVIGISDVIILVLMPGSGDSIQALKAGVMEIPDIIVVNKKDHPQAEQMCDEIGAMLCLSAAHKEWMPPILSTQAQLDEGVTELWLAVEDYVARQRASGELERRRARQLEQEVFALALQQMERHLRREAGSNLVLADILAQVARREVDPLTAQERILTEVFGVSPVD
ncbi:MAG: methylmalonyl Co-A mutase-associated GTPase MeaB [Gaiellales bacterium]|nr:methylmalonyl Co-A mutase-associated GTPase MeaB [Gaiellales bacterium]